jgi:hypothetical protein
MDKVKAVGLANGEHGKGFLITVESDGLTNTFTARRQQNGKYNIRLGLFEYENLLLREAKEAALEFVAGPAEDTQANDDKAPKALWSCVAPCALVAELLAIAEATVGQSDGFDELKKSALRTLDCYGFLCEDGSIDGDLVRREFELVKRS